MHQIPKRKYVGRLLLTYSQRRKSVSRALLTDFLFGFFCCFLFVLCSNVDAKWFKRCTMHSHVLILHRLNHFTWVMKQEKRRFPLRLYFPFSICSLQKWKVAIFFWGFRFFASLNARDERKENALRSPHQCEQILVFVVGKR
jgi:hypothetical protein